MKKTIRGLAIAALLNASVFAGYPPFSLFDKDDDGILSTRSAPASPHVSPAPSLMQTYLPIVIAGALVSAAAFAAFILPWIKKRNQLRTHALPPQGPTSPNLSKASDAIRGVANMAHDVTKGALAPMAPSPQAHPGSSALVEGGLDAVMTGLMLSQLIPPAEERQDELTPSAASAAQSDAEEHRAVEAHEDERLSQSSPAADSAAAENEKILEEDDAEEHHAVEAHEEQTSLSTPIAPPVSEVFADEEKQTASDTRVSEEDATEEEEVPALPMGFAPEVINPETLVAARLRLRKNGNLFVIEKTHEEGQTDDV